MDISTSDANTQDNMSPTPNPINAGQNTVGSNEPSSDKQSTTGSSSTRGKTDHAWEYFSLKKEGKTNVYTCLFCSAVYRGGGINRMKQHLAGIIGQISSCKKVPHDIRHRMKESLKEVQLKKKLDNIREEYGEEEGCELAIAPTPTSKVLDSHGKRKATGIVENYFAPRTSPGSQPSIKSVLSSKEAQHNARIAIAQWAFINCIPFNTMNCSFFQKAVDAIAAMGPGFKAPTAYDMRVNLLGDWKKECQLLIESHRAKWQNNGCTLMADGWTDVRQRTLINFLVYSTKGIAFVKSVDASDMVKDAKALFSLFCDVIEWVGPANIVHVVTDNAANYVACGRLIKEKYRHIYWSPCAAHCLNLILKDIASMPHISNLQSKASKITIFVYNHTIFLSWLRKREGWKEIVRPGVTRFATTFITLYSIHEHKHHLQALAVDKHFVDHKLSKIAAGRQFSAIVLEKKFWDDCYETVKIAAPLIRLLRLVDSDEKPSMGYVYEGMSRAKKAIKIMFHNKKENYKPYTNIIQARWDKHLKNDLHAAAYLLNPAILYDNQFCNKRRIMDAMLDLFEANSSSSYIEMITQLTTYRERDGSFSRDQTIAAASRLEPHIWWDIFGGSVPELQKLAIRVLSQTSSSSGCERNWSLFERIHTKRRNRLEHQRLNDLVFVNYNLRLQYRSQLKKRSYDPIDYESIDKVDFWVTEEDATPEFDDADFQSETFIPSRPQGENEGDENVNIPDPPPLTSLDADRYQHDSVAGSSSLSLAVNESPSEEFNLNDFYDGY